MITIENRLHEGLEVEAVRVTSDQDLRELRDDEWTEGALSLLTYPSSVIGFIGYEPPKYFGGLAVEAGDIILKGPGGDFAVLRGAA